MPSNGFGDSNGHPSVITKRPASRQDHPQFNFRDPFPVIPHSSMYAGKYNIVNSTYNIYFDEALRDSQTNSLVMRRDGYVHELLRHRQLPVVCLPYHIAVDNPDHPDQKKIGETIEQIFRSIPKLRAMMLVLLESTYYGKYAAHTMLGPRHVSGNTWNSIIWHVPVNGDKLRYKWDGTPGIAIYAGDRNDTTDERNKFLALNNHLIESTMLGPALFLKTPFLRDRFVIHEFEGFDTDYLFEIDQGLAVHGLGLRSRLYWTWNLRVEILSWIVDALQRVGANGMLYGFYQEGNPKGEQQTLTALRQLVKDNVAVFPIAGGGTPSDFKDLIQRIEPSPVGYDVMLELLQYLDGIMRRAVLGQDLSSQSKPTGIGGGASVLQGNVRDDFIDYDSSLLAETLTDQILSVILKYNIFVYEGKPMWGSQLPFTCRMEYQLDRENVEGAIQAATQLFEMGVDLDADDLRKRAGLSPPKKKGTAVVNHQLKAMQQQNAAGVPAMNKMNQSLGGVLQQAGAARKVGMLGGQPGARPDGQSNGKPNGRNAAARMARLANMLERELARMRAVA